MKQQLKEKDPYSAGTYPSLLCRGLELSLSDGNPPGTQTLNTGPPRILQTPSLSIWVHLLSCTGVHSP